MVESETNTGPVSPESEIVTVALLGELTVRLASLKSVTITVSVLSAVVSWTGVTVMVAEVEPAGMVTDPANGLKSLPPLAVPLTA